ncbi:uncharacterized GPI-anchored protein At1g61900-like isoform X2 [Magnolia sinica]|uniref:uncharacterized GPI-anchored protein At1g61900-like isoform X2 n=1 Tax=Magnolia sinica TaxID=86752 RepID=UPI00265B4F42|nr:uncharacterized GPI-anchored protein At1g61900-like isoform X2 [Magnolia sinica]
MREVEMREGLSLNLNKLSLLFSLILFLCSHESNSKRLDSSPDFQSNRLQLLRQLLSSQRGSVITEEENTLLPDNSPSKSPQPFIPLLAPSPLKPFANSSVPRLSGHCSLNFSIAERLISTTAVDCWASFAPFLANVICCPQLQATLAFLVGQSSKDTGMLALGMSHANHCMSDIEQILASRGAAENLHQICSIHPSNLTEASCPIKDIHEFESVTDTSKLLAACEKVDPVNECCRQICQNAISEAAQKIALGDGGLSGMNDVHISTEHLSRFDDCKSIVLRWLASRLDPLPATQVLRRISNCNLNKVCPLVFPNTTNVAKYCANGIDNRRDCCNAMENYISHLQKQSFITNLQALNCAALLGSQLLKVNISENLYSLCHITLKDFSLQESGCLLPSLPSDATFDPSSGISFTCDLNDNIAAPWPSTYQQLSISSCNRTVNMPALPAATTSQSGQTRKEMILPLLLTSSMIITTFV